MSTRRVTTADGVELALHRLRAHRDRRPAVLLVHGAFSGHTVWTRPVAGGDGLAHFFLQRGFDVWLGDLRHHGASEREPRSRQWCFEDWILRDAPAFVDRVKEETGYAPLAWAGHSAGGVVGLCWLARTKPPPETPALDAVVTFGAPGPGRMGMMRWWLAAIAIGICRALGRFPARALRFGSEDEAAGIFAQWMRWNVRGGWVGSDGFDYFAALGDVRTPLLAVAGEADTLFAPPPACNEVVERIGAARKTLLVYQHLSHKGMLLDPRARERCWPELVNRLGEVLTAA
ncbi:MAG: alpha/beta hydrolase [Gemmatimonadetes bacterium]|nr:alpha/beta hydrolase [Gemmatimonadota bacterium]